MYIHPFRVPDSIITPSDFRGLDPSLPIKMYSRLLPHWRQEGATYFVTFRTEDSLPIAWWSRWVEALRVKREAWAILQASGTANALSKWREQWEVDQRAALVELDQALDAGSGRCPFRQPEAREVVCNALLHFEGIRSRLYGFVVMPNHVHLAVKPLPGVELEDLLQSWRSYSAKIINRAAGASGTFWQTEYFDRIVRDEGHLRRVIRYLARNPIQAGCGHSEAAVWVSPDLQMETPGMIREGSMAWPESPW